MKTYLVTGAAGFIGANFVKYMLRKHSEVRLICLDLLTYAGYLGTIDSDIDNQRCIFVRGDIGDRELVSQLMSQYDIDIIVNFAAESHVDRSIENPQLFLQTNILGTQTLLEAAKKAWQTGKGEDGFPTYREGVRYHQVSTDEVYGSLGAEGYFTESTPLDPHSPYSASKASADHIVAAYRDTYHLPVSTTRCSNNYGPYQFPEKLIPLIIGNILQAKPLPVYGKGENIRDWLYVEDHCKAIDMVINQAQAGSVYNVGGHNERQNIVIVRTILALVRQEIEADKALRTLLPVERREDLSWIGEGLITYVTDRLGHDLRYGIDPQKIKEDLGWYPETDFETGIRKTIHWYLHHREWVDAVSGSDYQEYYEKMYAGR